MNRDLFERLVGGRANAMAELRRGRVSMGDDRALRPQLG
jgi:hypothetical protein